MSTSRRARKATSTCFPTARTARPAARARTPTSRTTSDALPAQGDRTRRRRRVDRLAGAGRNHGGPPARRPRLHRAQRAREAHARHAVGRSQPALPGGALQPGAARADQRDRKSTRLNSSHTVISYAVFCLKKKKKKKRKR